MARNNDDDDDRPIARARRRDDDDDDDRPRRRRRHDDDDDDDDDEGDATGGLIPYKNSKALTAYYVSIFNLILCIIPLAGLIGGIIAIVLGFGGLKYAREHPKARGQAHAIVAIVVGGFVVLTQLSGIIYFIVMMAFGRR